MRKTQFLDALQKHYGPFGIDNGVSFTPRLFADVLVLAGLLEPDDTLDLDGPTKQDAANRPACDAYSYTTAWSDEDKVFVARCKEFPILGAHGDTAEEALAEIKFVVQTCIEDAAVKGWPIPPSNSLDHPEPSEQT